MRRYIIFRSLIVLLACLLSSFSLSAQIISNRQAKDPAKAIISENQSKGPVKVIDKIQLQGLWESWGYRVHYDSENGPFMDAMFEDFRIPEHLYFEGDSLWVMQYPCQLSHVSAYHIDDWFLDKKVWFKDDKVLTKGGRRSYEKIEFDPAIIKQLQNDKLAPECYAGEWRLVRAESGGDGTGADYLFPFDMADSIIVDVASLSPDKLKDGIIELNIGGKLRPFYFHSTYRDFHHHITLEPTESWNKSDARMWKVHWGHEPEFMLMSEEDKRKYKQQEGEDLILEYIH